MAALHIPAHEALELTSYDEVVLSALETPENQPVWDPAFAREFDLGITDSNHYLERRDCGDGISMLSHDFDFGVSGSYRKIRETIFNIGGLVHHYLLDAKGGDVALISGEVMVDRHSRQMVMDTIAPPVLMATQSLAQVDIRVGDEYRRAVLLRAHRVGLVASEAAAAQFVKDSAPFMEASPQLRRSRPQVGVISCATVWRAQDEHWEFQPEPPAA